MTHCETKDYLTINLEDNMQFGLHESMPNYSHTFATSAAKQIYNRNQSKMGLGEYVASSQNRTA